MSDTRHEPTEQDVRHHEDTERNRTVGEEASNPTTGEDAPQSDEGGPQFVFPNPDLEEQEPRGSQVRHDEEHGFGAKDAE